MRDRIIQLTSDLVAFDTTSREEDAQLYLADVLSAAGFDCEIQMVLPGRPNLIARRGAGGVFLCSHVDVHPPHGHPDPFRCRVDGDQLIGRGVLDAKGQIAAAVAAVESVADAPAFIAITCDEEGGGKGSEALDIPHGPWFTDGGIVLEPTGFQVCTAQAGNVDVRVDVSATPGHAYGSSGSSPVHAILAVIEELDTCPFLKTDHPLLGRPLTNIGKISGGEHAWRSPGHADLHMTLGVVPPTEVADAETEVRNRLDELARRWTSRNAAFHFEIADASDPIEVDASLPIVERLGATTTAGMPSWTDAENLLTKHKLPCVVFGAGDLAVAHSDHERVGVDDLVEMGRVLTSVLSS